MERALFVTCIEDLRHAYSGEFDRIYFGHEFCHWLMPSALQLRSAISFAELLGLPLTFVTPVLSEAGLERVRPLIGLLPVASEIVVNDFGLIDEIVAAGHRPLFGRVLLKVKRDPRIGPEDLANEGLARHLRASNVSNRSFQALLLNLGVRRFELDNVQQGYELDLPAELHSSLYSPFVSAAITRRCGLNFAEGNQDDRWEEGSCREFCQTTQLEVSTIKRKGKEQIRASYSSRGASHFFSNAAPPSNTDGWNLDRLVSMPRPPVFASLPPDAFSENWDAAYREQGLAVPWNHEEADPILLKLAEREPPEIPGTTRAVELGCGTGRNADALQRLGFDILGIERSPAALALLEEHFSEVRAVVGDVLEYPLEDAAHALVVDYGCLHALEPAHWERYARRVMSTVAPGGRYLLFARSLPEGHLPEEPVFVVEGDLPEWGLGEDEARSLFTPSLHLEEVVAYEGETHEADSVVERFNYFLFRKPK